ncbi:hypothetical protein AVEN_53845-1 [Araneus ventricosus]|uniref:Uncharacterized protein n=1 Tax=Araneus ventricosus TaxID=182803 RepID=A0A4Y2RFL8_ARAVE|nr:hypothetical protein AVEN_53845-1 [Araneus ventricosus]
MFLNSLASRGALLYHLLFQVRIPIPQWIHAKSCTVGQTASRWCSVEARGGGYSSGVALVIWFKIRCNFMWAFTETTVRLMCSSWHLTPLHRYHPSDFGEILFAMTTFKTDTS